MKNNFFDFTYAKNRKTYRVIALALFISIVVMNCVFQFMALSITTVSDEILNNDKLALITFNGIDKDNMPYKYDDDEIKGVDHIVFAVKSCYLMMSFDNNGEEAFCPVYAADASHSDYLGIDRMEDGVVYLPENDFPGAERYVPKDEFSSEALPDTPLSVRNFEGSSPMVLSGDGFVTERTYAEISRQLGEEYFKAIFPEYIVGVDKVENVYKVIEDLEALAPDDDMQIFNQANGLKNVIKDTTQILYVLIALLCAMTVFIGFVTIYFATSLVGKNARDLMILYLNGMSRANISKYIYNYLQTRVNKIILPASAVSLLLFYLVTKFLLGRTEELYWLLILVAINVGVVFVNALICKAAIRRAVYKQTSNDRISKLIRN